MAAIDTALSGFTKLYTANTSAASITALVPTVTAPVADGSAGVFDTQTTASQLGWNSVLLVFYGTRSAADNETATAKITGWKLVGTLWVPIPLLALNLTQGTSQGVAGTVVNASQWFVDTITTSASLTTAVEIVSPADNSMAYLAVDVKGCRYVQAQLAHGTNATVNCLAAGY